MVDRGLSVGGGIAQRATSSARALRCAFALATLLFSCASELVADEPTPPKSPGIEWFQPKEFKDLGSLGFRLVDLPEQSFVLVFPEWITARGVDWHSNPKWKTTAGEATGTWIADQLALELQLAYRREDKRQTIAWSYAVKNGSSSPLKDVTGFNCFSLFGAPMFCDLTLERTWVAQGTGAKTVLSTIEKTRGPRTMQFYNHKRGIPLAEFERFMRYQVLARQSLEGDRIGVTSTNGRWQLEAIVDGPVGFFFTNWEADHGCVHAAPLVGDIAAGAVGTARGRIVFTQAE